MKTIASSSDIDTLLNNFGAHLVGTAGLAARTVSSQKFYVREFLQVQLKSARSRLKLQELKPEILLSYILERSKRDSPERLQAAAAALRSFCRFLRLRRVSRADLSSALPRIGSRGGSYLPEYLLPEQLRHLLDSIDTQSKAGLRNHAIILCLARLGLRAGEVARLTLDQIDWRASVLKLSPGKGRRERTLPLPKEVGRAVADYLRKRSGNFNSRRLFCGLRNRLPLSSAAISQVTRRALQHAGIRVARSGAHLLRRTVASHLVQQGVNLKAVADLLGHQSLNTTRIYAGVNHSMLSEVSRPWPVGVSR